MSSAHISIINYIAMRWAAILRSVGLRDQCGSVCSVLGLALGVLLVIGGCSPHSEPSIPPPSPVSKVELERYLGEWFAVARIPNRFESECLQSRAEYSLRGDGTIQILNSCQTKSGAQKSIEGRGWVLDQSNNKLKVGFFRVFGWYPGFARGDYWILGLGPIDHQGFYSYAVVGEPSRRYGWILARSTKLDERALKDAFKILREQGYSPEQFELL